MGTEMTYGRREGKRKGVDMEKGDGDRDDVWTKGREKDNEKGCGGTRARTHTDDFETERVCDTSLCR